MKNKTPLRSNQKIFSPMGRSYRRLIAVGGITLLGLFVVMIYLAPLGYMSLTAFKTIEQVRDVNSQLMPASPVTFAYEGKEYPLLEVPTEEGVRTLALFKPGREESDYIDPENPQAGTIHVVGRWRTFKPLYVFAPIFTNFAEAWDQISMDRLFRNTIFIAVVSTIGTLFSSIVVAYGFARFRIPGVTVLFLILISTIILPRQVTLIPTYVFFRMIGWGGTWWPLIIPHFFANAYNVFLLRQYFRGIPREMDEAAVLDGATPLQILWHVIIPQSIPAIIAVALFHFFFAWNDFFEPLVYLQGREDLYTLSIGMTQFTNIFAVQPGLAMSAAMMAIALPLVIFFLAQRVFMQGIVITGVDK